MTPNVVLGRPFPCDVPEGTPQSLDSLRPSWLIYLSILQREAAENGTQLCSRLDNILNVARRLRLRCCHRLQPCWMTFDQSAGVSLTQ